MEDLRGVGVGTIMKAYYRKTNPVSKKRKKKKSTQQILENIKQDKETLFVRMQICIVAIEIGVSSKNNNNNKNLKNIHVEMCNDKAWTCNILEHCIKENMANYYVLC